ncbi:MAG: glycosyltransferase [Patescibacteria group bacterium]
MKKLNIAIICDPLTHLISGSMISTIRFAGQLRKKGHKVIFLAAQDETKKPVTFFRDFKVYRFGPIKLPGSQGQYLLAYPRVGRIKGIYKEEQIDIVHTIDPTLLSIFSLRAARTMGIKTVMHSHMQPENVALQLGSFFQRPWFQNLIYRYLIWIYRKVNMVICPSEFAMGMLRKYNQTIPICVISNGVELSRFKIMDSAAFSQKYNLSPEEQKILYIGRLHKEKSVHTLIEAMPAILKEYPKTRLNLVGIGHLMDDLKKLATDLKVSESITFFGKLPDEEMALAYNACTFFVLPSVAELEGMAVLEAMACGKPVIISDSALSASSYFVKGNGFIFKLQNPQDLAEKCITLLKNPTMVAQMGEKSRTLAETYDIKKSGDKLESLYYSILA